MGTLIEGSEAEDGENSGEAGGATGSIWNRRRRRAGPSPPPAGSGPSNRSSESAKSEAPAAAAAAGRAESAAKRVPTAISRGGRWAGSTRRPLEAGRGAAALTSRCGLRGMVGCAGGSARYEIAPAPPRLQAPSAFPDSRSESSGPLLRGPAAHRWRGRRGRPTTRTGGTPPARESAARPPAAAAAADQNLETVATQEKSEAGPLGSSPTTIRRDSHVVALVSPHDWSDARGGGAAHPEGELVGERLLQARLQRRPGPAHGHDAAVGRRRRRRGSGGRDGGPRDAVPASARIWCRSDQAVVTRRAAPA